VPVYSNHPPTLYFIDNALTDCGFIKKDNYEYFSKAANFAQLFI
jgi:hypothetical protein